MKCLSYKKQFLSLLLFVFTLSRIQAQTIFISSNGKKYHSINCPKLKSDKKELSMEEAKKLGYSEHKKCKNMNIKQIEKRKEEEPAKKQESGGSK